MPEGPEKKALTIDDYAGFLRGLADAGFDFLVIGGIAVGGYLRLQGQELFSGDLDLYTTQETLDEILSWAPAHGARVLKRPQPRSIPTAFLEWDGKEVNVLTHSFGLPPAAKATQFARIFTLTKHGGLEVLLADPYDLLVNKLHVNRPKDQPHIELLRRFIEEECVGAFANEDRPRARLEPSRRLLATTKSRAL
ncbi:MAG: hypothetical protein HY721_10535, partial [Planctomycetes bacterium]|nr:hypothetical protein [Planctomycetota bacterium]